MPDYNYEGTLMGNLRKYIYLFLYICHNLLYIKYGLD